MAVESITKPSLPFKYKFSCFPTTNFVCVRRLSRTARSTCANFNDCPAFFNASSNAGSELMVRSPIELNPRSFTTVLLPAPVVPPVKITLKIPGSFRPSISVITCFP